MSIRPFTLLTLAMIAAFTASFAVAQGTAEFQKRRTWNFPVDGVSFSNEFSGARLNGVARTGENQYRLSITPEARPINDSAWFAFRVWAKASETIEITLAYDGGTHRYRPKVSLDGESWKLIRNVKVLNRRTQAKFSVEISTDIRVVAGQPLITMEDQMAWSSGLTKGGLLAAREIGKSVQGRPIPLLESKTAAAPGAPTLVLMTGQHPPEFSSVEGFRRFVPVLLADTTLAREFRSHFNLAIFPLMNPDGWYHGHWRCNANGVDPNRTWIGDGMKTVPEVMHAIAVLRKISNPVMFIDFHSTNYNVFYTGTDDDHEPRHIVPEFHDALTRRVPEWTWKREASHTSNGPPSRSWGTRELGIPSVTWEWSDIAGRGRLEAGSTAGAEELMRLLLELVRDETNPLARYDFENPARLGADFSGKRPAEGTGIRPAADPAFGDGAVRMAGGYLTIPDFDYASKGGALSFWFRMDRGSLGAADGTILFSHGNPAASGNLVIEHRRSISGLSIRVDDGSENSEQPGIVIDDAKVLDGKWHHLGVVITPGKGTSVFLNGISKGGIPNGSGGLDPEGPLRIGSGHDGSSGSRFKGSFDDFRIYGEPVRPYTLTAIRYPDAPLGK